MHTTYVTVWAEGETFEKACVDVVFAGLGWIAVTGVGRIDMNAWAPQGVGIVTRYVYMYMCVCVIVCACVYVCIYICGLAGSL